MPEIDIQNSIQQLKSFEFNQTANNRLYNGEIIENAQINNQKDVKRNLVRNIDVSGIQNYIVDGNKAV